MTASLKAHKGILIVSKESENWATLLILTTLRGQFQKSVAQFFALIFAYITPCIKSVNDILARIFLRFSEQYAVSTRAAQKFRKPHKHGISWGFEHPSSNLNPLVNTPAEIIYLYQ